MRIRGLIRWGKPFFRMQIRVAGIEGRLWLLADTGAARTTLLNRDVDWLRALEGSLEPAYSPMMGIGGSANWSWLRGAELVLPTDEGDLVIPHDICIVRHQLSGLPAHQAEHILSLPSMLGRDIIRRFRFIYEHATGTVLLEG